MEGPVATGVSGKVGYVGGVGRWSGSAGLLRLDAQLQHNCLSFQQGWRFLERGELEAKAA